MVFGALGLGMTYERKEVVQNRAPSRAGQNARELIAQIDDESFGQRGGSATSGREGVL